MKELSIEEKAKRYDEAVRESSKIINHCAGGANIPECVSVKATIEQIFPELKESEDERIELLNYLYNVHDDDEERARWIVWLEKQGEHANFRNKIQIGDKVIKNEDGVLVNLSQLKRVAKKDEQNLANSEKTCKDEQKSAWSEKYIADVFEKVGLAKIVREQSNDSLTNALQDAMIELSKFLPQQKQEWSEEDEEYLNDIIRTLRNFVVNGGSVAKKYTEEEVNWLKSLRPHNRWKPSDEQMEALKGVLEGAFRLDILESLYNDLLKLKE